MKRFLPIIALALVLIAGGGWFLSQSGSTPPELPVGAANAQQSSEVDTSQIVEMIQGNADSSVQVIEYASFTCPHCASFHNSALKDIKKNYIDTGKIGFTYREVYFDKYGMWASMIARCAGPEKFFGITDMVYKTQSGWARAGSDAEIADELRKIGRLAGIGDDALQACLTDSDKLKTLVAWYQQNAQEHDINSTPSFIINGKKYSNMNYADFSALLDEKLAE